MMEPLKQDSLMLPDGTGRIKGGTMKKVDFCVVRLGLFMTIAVMKACVR